MSKTIVHYYHCINDVHNIPDCRKIFRDKVGTREQYNKKICDQCRSNNHKKHDCMKFLYDRYLRCNKIENFYTDIIDWPNRRLLWLGNKKCQTSYLSLLPQDLIKHIDNILISEPFYDLIEIVKNFPALPIETYGLKLTIISNGKMKIPRKFIKDVPCMWRNNSYLFVIGGHVHFTNDQCKILKKYELKYKHVTECERGGN